MSYEDYESPRRRGSDRYDDYMLAPRGRTYRDYNTEERPHRPAYREDDRPRQGRNYMRDEVDKRQIKVKESDRGRREVIADPLPRRGGGRLRTHQDGSASKPSRVLGVFGLSTYTTERDLYDIFSDYGAVEDIQLVYDSLTGRSRGFAFVYYESLGSAQEAKVSFGEGLKIAGRVVRVDYSITNSAHPPTPGIYMGKFRRPVVDEDDYRRGSRPFSRKGLYAVDGPGRRYEREEYPPRRGPPPGPSSYSRRPIYDDPPFRRDASGMPPRHSRDRYQLSSVRRRKTKSSSRSRSPPPIYRGQKGGGGVKAVSNREEKQKQTSVSYNGRSRSAHSFASLSPVNQPKLLEQGWADDQA